MQPHFTLPGWFWSKVDKSGDCWLWLGGVDRKGYGRFSLGGRLTTAHRLAYESLLAPVPTALTLDHLCRRPSCVRPEHLEVVSIRENILRGQGVAAICARRTRCVHGHPFDLFNTYLRPNGKRDCRTPSMA